MCGILSILRYNYYTLSSPEMIKENFLKHSERGPEESIFIKVTTRGEQQCGVDNTYHYLGFHRLAINGYKNNASSQPIRKKNCILTCNGEIYNWKELANKANVECGTGSDCEIIIDLYRKYGIEYTLQVLDGVFAFTLIDEENNEAIIARDPMGVRPLFIWLENNKDSKMGCQNINNNAVIVASELKLGESVFPKNTHTQKLKAYQTKPEPFPPGHYLKISLRENIERKENITMPTHLFVPYYSLNIVQNPNIYKIEQTFSLVRSALMNAVNKRVDNTDRGIACLLSGGLDSSLIAALVAKELSETYGQRRKNLHTWSIGLEGSEDLKYAQIVANYIGSTHHEIKLSEKEFLDAIPNVIEAIESNDTTTVRASVGNWLICKYIKMHSEKFKHIPGHDFKVIFNGDGSDEVCGGYLYFHAAPSPLDFDKECKRLLKDLHLFDVLRSDRSISSHGLEARTPFLDKNFIQSYLSIPDVLRDHRYNRKCEKYILRKAFEDMMILPYNVIWRTKEAFSDGVSKSTKSWFRIIQEFASKKYNEKDLKKAEQMYYDDIFYNRYGFQMSRKTDEKYLSKVMPYKWMPRFIDATDASARTLKIYNQINQDSIREKNANIISEENITISFEA